MAKNNTKYIFVFGGVISGLGKGIVASSLGYLLKSVGMKVTIQKLDPYLNVDPGTMSPYQHGEVFVTEDGTETDLDQPITKTMGGLIPLPPNHHLVRRKTSSQTTYTRIGHGQSHR